MASSKLPAFALFPLAAWRDQLLPDEWVACLDAWLVLVDSHLSLDDVDIVRISAQDDSLIAFLTSFVREAAVDGVGILGSSQSAKNLLKDTFQLTSRLLKCHGTPTALCQWEFLADLSRVYGPKKTEALLSEISDPVKTHSSSSLADLKRFLIKNLDAGIRGGDLRAIEERLDRLSDYIHASPQVAGFFLAGDDFLDGLISCFEIMNPPLRRVLVSTTYLCLVGLADDNRISALTDQLYSLKTAADKHKTGPLNANDSLVAELVTSTPILQQLQRKLDETGSTSSRTKSVLTDLGRFRKPGGGMPRPKRLVRRKIDKGKGIAEHDEAEFQQEMHIHRTSQISQVQDLFPELGSGFVSKLLDEYNDDTEQIIAHLLEESLPAHLQSADRGEQLSSKPVLRSSSALPPRSTPPLAPLPARHNIFDSDDLLSVPLSQLQLGKRALDADMLLADRSTAPNKASILAALAAFDSDDDERDDTYDADDVGGTIDTAHGDDDLALTEGAEATLFRVHQATPRLFARDQGTRRSVDRARLREETAMTDEQIEGWSVMLARTPLLRKRLQARYGEWTGAQNEIGSTAWRAGEEGEEDEGTDGGAASGPGQGQGQTSRGGAPGRGFGGGRGRGRGRGGRGGQGPGGVPTPPDSEAARRRKEANKGSRANHNRRDQRARKMARGGLPG